MNKVKLIVQWVLVALFALCAIAWCPSLASIFFLLAAIIVLPVKVIEDALEKIKLKFAVRIVIAVVLLVIGIVTTPEEPPATAYKKAAENKSSSEEKNNKDDKKDNNKSDGKEDNKDDIKDQIIGTWDYGASRAVDSYYTFNEDGTWSLDSDGGEYDIGTYEIIDGKTIKMKGGSMEHSFTIESADKLLDDYGETLKRFTGHGDD